MTKQELHHPFSVLKSSFRYDVCKLLNLVFTIHLLTHTVSILNSNRLPYPKTSRQLNYSYMNLATHNLLNLIEAVDF